MVTFELEKLTWITVNPNREALPIQYPDTLEMQYRVLTASNNGIVICDARCPTLPIVYVNPAFEKMTGYLASDILGESCW